MAKSLDHARTIYMEGIRDGKARETIEAHTGVRYTQHSTGVGDDVEGFVEFFEPFIERNPVREIQIVHGLQDGRYAFLHAYQSLNDGAARWVTMDLFDSDAEGKIVEHWDVIQPYSPTTASGEDMVGGPSDVADLDHAEANKALVREYTKQVRQMRYFDRLDRFVAPDLKQHQPSIAAGRDGLGTWLDSEEGGRYEMLFMLLGEGNFVVTYGKRHVGDQDHASVDLYRLDDGLIVEQWGVTETILSRDQWGNSGKF